MSIFAPQNVMRPAHRGGVIQHLAQGAAQNVMRRQKLKALLQHTAGQAGGHTVGRGQPFRASTQGHATGVRGAVQRPPQFMHGLGATAQAFQGQGFANQADMFSQPDPGTLDLPSLPDAADPSQSPSSTSGPQVVDPTDPGSGSAAEAPAASYYIGPDGQPVQYSPAPAPSPGTYSYDTGVLAGGVQIGSPQANGASIPLGNGLFYDPISDAIHGLPKQR